MTQTPRRQASRKTQAMITGGGDEMSPRPAIIAPSGAAAPSMHSGNPLCSSKTRSAMIVTGGDEMSPRPAIIAPRAALASSAHSGNLLHSDNSRAVMITMGGDEMSPRPATIARREFGLSPCIAVTQRIAPTINIALGGDDIISEASHNCNGQNGARLQRCIAVTHCRRDTGIWMGSGECKTHVLVVVNFVVISSYYPHVHQGPTWDKNKIKLTG